MENDSNYFYLNFEIQEEERFYNLKNLFDAIKAVKDIVIRHNYDLDFDPLEKMDWLSFLDEKAINNQDEVFNFENEEGQTYQKLWNLTPPKVRLSHPFFILPNPWDYESILDSIFNGEYTLISIKKNSSKSATLYFAPWAGPFGETEALVALIELFGHHVTYDSWHKGPHKSRTSEWNFQIAKELVNKNTGIEVN